MIKNTAISTLTMDFPSSSVKCYFDIPFKEIKDHIDAKRIIWVTDENIYPHYADNFPLDSSIILPTGEENKNIDTVSKAIDELLIKDADREVFLVGVGGGIVTDITGFLASVYLRGVRFAFVPTSILAMVDASIGGKNGVNVGPVKNQIGIIRQPEFLFYDFKFLKTLSDIEWVSGFGEIIKHACIADAEMFRFLESKEIDDFEKDPEILGELIKRNAEVKYKIAAADETEGGKRRLLNFGHTIGHAIENISGLPHGHSISIGMAFACQISEQLSGFPHEDSQRVLNLLAKYHLNPVSPYQRDEAWKNLIHDKKVTGESIYYILLRNIGDAYVEKISLESMKKFFFELNS